MPIHILDDTLWFPPVDDALDDGLLAAGGDLGTDRLLLAYRSGIFPWFNEDEVPMWWSPDPRFVLFPDELRVSKSMRQVLKQDGVGVEFRVGCMGCCLARYFSGRACSVCRVMPASMRS